ncbi:MAG: T9SS type A sorting domain-containing protein [Bacteroidales bacterium]
MKKLLLVSMMFSLTVLFSFGQDTITFVERWAHFGENAPAWFTDGSEAEDGSPAYAAVERGIVYSDYSGHVYVSSRHAIDTDEDGVLDVSQPHVYILDPYTGEAPAFGLSKLLTTGINSSDENYGGGYPLNNVTATEDGSIFACNMTLASGPDVQLEGGYVSVKAFRVYRWSWEQDIPQTIIDYKQGGYRLGDKFSVIGNWDSEAYIYAGAGETNKILRWKSTAGVVDESPTVITLQDIANVGTSPTVAGVPGKADWIYVSGKGFMPTLFTTAGVNLSQVAISTANHPSAVLAGRIVEFGGKLLMGMFCGDQSGYVFDISKHGENVTDVDVIGFTPTFGVRFDNAFGEGAVEFGVLDDTLHLFVCAPSNGIACFKIDGLVATTPSVREFTKVFGVKAFPNPATAYADFRFTLPDGASGPVSVKLFDISGKFLGIVAGKAIPGEQTIRYNTSQLSAGAYVYQIVHDNKIESGQLLIK